MPRWWKVLTVPVSAEAWDKDANSVADTEAGAAAGPRAREGRQGGCHVWLPLQGAVHIPPLMEILTLVISFSQMRHRRCFCPSPSHFSFPFSVQPHTGQLQRWATLECDLLSPLRGGCCQKSNTYNPSWKSNSPSPKGWLEVRSVSAWWQSVCSAPGASWVAPAGASTGPHPVPCKHDVTGRRKSHE